MFSIAETVGPRQPRSDGKETRERILALLRKCRETNQDSPTELDIARLLKISRSNAKHHCRHLRKEGFVSFRNATRAVKCVRIDLVDSADDSEHGKAAG